MGNAVEKCLEIARIVLLESLRRKDAYVVLILGLAIGLAAGLFSTFGAEGLGKFVKDVTLTIANVFAVVICVAAAARQFPTERESRTLFPLLAKPVGRFTVFFGKFLGVGFMTSLVVVAFFIELRLIYALFQIEVGPIFYQALYLRVLSMWIIAALVLTLSLVLTHAANVAISLLLTMAMQNFAHAILTIHTSADGMRQLALKGIYWIVPHLELFNLSKKVVHEWAAIPLWVLAVLTVYAAIYAGIFVVLGTLQLRRMAL